MNHRIFERTLRPVVFRGACLFERHCDQITPGVALGLAVEPPLNPVAVPCGSKRSKDPRYSPRAVAGHQPPLLSTVDLGSGRDTR